MPQKRHTVDQIVSKLRKADVELGKGKKAAFTCKLQEIISSTHRTDLLPLAAEVWWHEARDGQATESSGERERKAEEDGSRASPRYGDPQGGRQGKLVSPERRRRTVSTVRSRLGPERVSERRACRVLGQPRNTQRYQSRRVDDEPRLLREMRLLARQRPRFGSGRIYRLLTQRGWTVNEKRVHRLWKREHMQVPRKQHRKRRFPGGSENGCVRHRAR